MKNVRMFFFMFRVYGTDVRENAERTLPEKNFFGKGRAGELPGKGTAEAVFVCESGRGVPFFGNMAASEKVLVKSGTDECLPKETEPFGRCLGRA